MSSQKTESKIEFAIIGAGMAGLSAGLLLSNAGKQITVFEAAPNCGGRARSLKKHPLFELENHNDNSGAKYLDNAPHLIMGAYKSFLQILQIADVNINQLFDIRPFAWQSNKLTIKMGSGKLIPALIKSHFQSKGLSPLKRLGLIRVFAGLYNSDLENLRGISVSEWLAKLNISAEFSKQFFTPLCLSALNTHPDEACAIYFAKILQEVFFAGNSNSWQMLWAKVDLGQIISQPLIRKIIINPQNKINTNCRIKQINKHENSFELITNKEKYFAENVIIATSLNQSINILENSSIKTDENARDIITKLKQIKTRAIASCYGFVADESVTKKINTLPILQHQIFENIDIVWVNFQKFRHVNNQQNDKQPHPNLAAIYSCILPDAVDGFTARAFSELLDNINMDKWLTITEKLATPASTINKPQINNKIINGLFLCGDYLSDNLPATIETSARSAFSLCKALGINIVSNKK